LNLKQVPLRKFSEQAMNSKRFLSYIIFALIVSFAPLALYAQAAENTPATTENKEAAGEKKMDISSVIFGHIADSHEWHLFSIGEKHIGFPLPVIIYNTTKGLAVFSSSRIAEGEAYEGYKLDKSNPMKEKIVAEDGSKFYDISITKNVFSMLISVVILLWIMTSVAKKYTQNGAMKAPSGMQNAIEVVTVFMRDEVAKPNLGANYKKYFPFLLTLFFFIWINNLLGLLPGGANFTGNIACTALLALVSFIVMLFNSNKHFWSHLLNPPVKPAGIKLLLVPIEIMSLFIKPAALMIRLLANIMAGHIVILSVICMIFIFGALNKFIGVGFVPVSLAFSIFMFMLELLVGAIQAFIFTNLTSVFLGQAMEGDHSHDEAHGTETAHH
jgi:F-type H+-transporting ATPase subunit a